MTVLDVSPLQRLLRRPPVWVAAVVTVLLIAGMAGIRLVVFGDRLIAVSYAIPLMSVLWTRSRGSLFTLAIGYSVLAFVKNFIMPLPDNVNHDVVYQGINWGMQLVNIWVTVGVLVVCLQAIEKIAHKGQQLFQANRDLEASNEELATREEEIIRQNEELQSQTQELERQAEELRQQAEELEQQTVEMHAVNDELSRREKGLQTLLESARWLRSDLSERDVMSAVCQAAAQVMEEGVDAAAVVNEQHGKLVIRGHFGFGVQGQTRQVCAFDRSFAAIVMEQRQTGYIADLETRPDIEVPQPAIGKPFRSILASPLYLEGRVVGAVEVYSTEVREWSDSEFKVIEWLAAQCSIAQQAINYQQEVLIKRREAEEASIQKTRFLAAVSHDVRTPANAISLMADVIERAAGNPEQQAELPAMVRDLKANARSLVELVSDVLDLAKLDTGKLDLQLSEFSLSQVIQNECKQFQRIAAEKHLRLSAPMEDTLHLRTDRMKLARVIANLVGNAVKFTETGSIEVRCQPQAEGGATITIKDTGVGMPQEALVRIFDEFYQLENRERDRNKGSGLGLAICKRLVESLGCSIAVESAVGVGTMFTLKIPAELVVDSSYVAREKAAQASAETSLHGTTVLLVEDHDVTRRAAARLLTAQGAVVLEARTGKEAMHRLVYDSPHVVLLDLMLPDIDGADILRFLGQHRQPNLRRVLAVSGDVRESRIREVRALGADDLVAKPLDIQKLLHAITAIELKVEALPEAEVIPREKAMQPREKDVHDPKFDAQI